jgi:hypothetical protein
MEEDDHALGRWPPGSTRKTTRPRGVRSQYSGLRLIAGQGTVESPRSFDPAEVTEALADLADVVAPPTWPLP